MYKKFQPTRKISFCSELTSLKFQVVYASQNAGCHSFSRQKTLTTHYRKFCVGIPVVRTDGLAGGRSVYGHVIAEFSRMGSLPHFLTLGASRARAPLSIAQLPVYELMIY